MPMRTFRDFMKPPRRGAKRKFLPPNSRWPRLFPRGLPDRGIKPASAKFDCFQREQAMLVYGDAERVETTDHICSSIASMLAATRETPPGIERHGRLVGAFV